MRCQQSLNQKQINYKTFVLDQSKSTLIWEQFLTNSLLLGFQLTIIIDIWNWTKIGYHEE